MSRQVSIDSGFLGPIAERIPIALVKNTTFVGPPSTNPSRFHHYDMTNLVLYINGVQHPSEPHLVDCSTPFRTTPAYEKLYSSTGIHHHNRAHMITLEMFTKEFNVLGFDLTPDKEADEEHVSLARQGNVRIETRFKKTTTRTVYLHFVC